MPKARFDLGAISRRGLDRLVPVVVCRRAVRLRRRTDEDLDGSARRGRSEDRDAVSRFETKVTAGNDETIVPFDGDENGIMWPGHLGHPAPRESGACLDLGLQDDATGSEPSNLPNIPAERRSIR